MTSNPLDLIPYKSVFEFNSKEEMDSFISQISIYRKGRRVRISNVPTKFKNTDDYFVFGLYAVDEFFIYESDLGCRKAMIADGFEILSSKFFTMMDAYTQLELDKED